jgi:ubiquinone/menaquinone biosynthesis C-methylase UbiE
MRRVTSSELLDADLGTAAEVADSLDDLWRINRWLGGVSSNLRLLEAYFARYGARELRILDVGAGDGRLAARLRERLRDRGVRADFVAIDSRLQHLRRVHLFSSAVQPVIADALRLPFPHNSFEVCMCNLFFHHFSGADAVQLLRSLAAVASQAVLVNDLERHLIPYLFIRTVPLFSRSRLTRHDAPASVRQSYTREELAGLALEAGFHDFAVHRLAPFRLGLSLWKQASQARTRSCEPGEVGLPQ